ncbi:MAG: CDP-alcohol phosphatidyltransferase family protein [Planctomycetota bacterium]
MKKIVILPTLLTLGNAAFGFTAIAVVIDAAFRGGPDAAPTISLEKVGLAGLLIFCAMVCDALDGIVARLVGGTSDFGGHLDSLADIVSFGVAPALLIKTVVQYDFHLFLGVPNPALWAKLAWIITGIYCLCAILRLARFDDEKAKTAEESTTEYFDGLPTPGAAGVLVGLAMLYAYEPALRVVLAYIMTVAVPLLGALMVSRLPFPHFVNKVLLSRHSFKYVLVFAATVVVVLASGVYLYALAGGFVTYALAVGPVLAVRRWISGRSTRATFANRIKADRN